MAPIKSLKKRLVAAFQQQQQQETLAAQASRAADLSGGSDHQPHSSETQGPTAEPAALPVLAIATAPVSAREGAALPTAPCSAAERLPPPCAPANARPESRSPAERCEAPTSPIPPSAHFAPPATAAAAEPLDRLHGHSDLVTKRKDSPKHAALTGALPRKKPKKEGAVAVPLDVLRKGGKLMPVGAVAATTCASYSELWTAVGRVCGDQLNRATARLMYQDSEGDWLVLLPDLPFATFTSCVRRILVVPKKD